MSNNSTPASCGYAPSFFDLVYNTNFFAYNIASPLYFFFSFTGHGILLLAFLKQLKSERTYMYQVYCAVVKFLEVIVRTRMYAGMKLFLLGTPILRDSFRAWMSQCYTCVWYDAYLSSPLSASFTTLSLLLATAMAADRVLSVVKPLVYKNMQHKRSQLIVLLVSITVSFSASAFDTMRFGVFPGEGSVYRMLIDTVYISLPIVKALALLRVFMQGAVLIVLVVLSIALCYFYRTKFVNMKAKFTNSTDQDKAKEDERALILITLVECTLTILGICVMLTYYGFIYCYPIEYNCYQTLVLPLNDSCRMLIDLSNFYLVFAISKKFRATAKTVLLSWSNCGRATKVISLSSQNAAK